VPGPALDLAAQLLHRGVLHRAGELHQLDVAHPQQGQLLERGARADEPGHRLVGRVGQDRLRGVVLQDSRLRPECSDPVPELDGLGEVVGDEDDGLVQLGLQADQLVLQQPARDGVHGPEGLVHEQHRRVGCERPGDADALLLPAGELAGVAVAVLAWLEADEVEHLFDAGVDPVLLPAGQTGDHAHVLGDRHVREQPGLLDGVTDPPAELVRVQSQRIPATDRDAPGGGLDEAVDHLHGGGLAAARRPDEYGDLPGRDRHGDVLDRGLLLAGVPLGHPLEDDLHTGDGVGVVGLVLKDWVVRHGAPSTW